MALLFCDSQDHYLAGDLAKKYSTITVGWNNSVTGYNATIPDSSAILTQPTSTTMPPMGGAFISTNNSGSSRAGMAKAITSSATVIVGGWFYFTTNPITASGSGTIYYCPLLGVADSTSLQFSLWGDGSGKLVVYRGMTVVATSTNTLTLNTWHHLEMKVKIDPTVGTYEVRVNGAAWIGPTTGANTRASANSTADKAVWGTSGTSSIYYKNNYVLNDSGSVGNDFVGPCRIAVLRPANPGAVSDWTPNGGTNATCVGETIFDGDSSFNQSGTAGQKDTFDMTAMPAASGTVYGVQAVLGMRQDAGAQRTVRVIQRHSGSDSNWTSINPSGTHGFFTDAKSVSPVTSSGFTISEINGDEFGYELVS